MNIISVHKILCMIILTGLSLPVLSTAGDNSNTAADSGFALSAEIGTGVSTNLNPVGSGYTKQNFAPSLRILWKPNRRLNIGIETGYLVLGSRSIDSVASAFGTTTFRGSMKAIPLILVFSMEIWEMEISGGLGAGYVTSEVDAFGSKTRTSFWYNCYYASAGYSWRILPDTGLGIEARIYSFSKLEEITGTISVKLSYDFFHW